MRFAALVVAAGRGMRAGGGVPKQYRLLGGRPVLAHTVARFLAHPALGALCVVIHPDDAAPYAEAMAGLGDPRVLPPAAGGETRAASVRAGLMALPDDPDCVLIHDAARPFTPVSVIDGVLAALAGAPGAVPVLPIVDALWRGAGAADTPMARDGIWRAPDAAGLSARRNPQRPCRVRRGGG